MTWRELQEALKEFPEKFLDKPVQFYFNGGVDSSMKMLLTSENNQASLKFVNELSDDEVKSELEICAPYIYVDEIY